MTTNSKLSEALKRYWASGEAAARRAKDAADSVKRDTVVRSRNMRAGMNATKAAAVASVTEKLKKVKTAATKKAVDVRSDVEQMGRDAGGVARKTSDTVKDATKRSKDRLKSEVMKRTGNSRSGSDIRARK